MKGTTKNNKKTNFTKSTFYAGENLVTTEEDMSSIYATKIKLLYKVKDCI
jgi:hypothetical protein